MEFGRRSASILAMCCITLSVELANAAEICKPQCTDYVNQQLHLKHYVGNAIGWWHKPPAGYHKRSNGSSDSPDRRDIVVWDTVGGGNGHVAIVVSSDDRSVTVRDSNWASNWRTDCKVRTHKLNLTRSGKKGHYTYRITNAHVVGWLSK